MDNKPQSLFGSLVDNHTSIEDRQSIPVTKSVTDETVKHFIEHQLHKIKHVLDYLKDK